MLRVGRPDIDVYNYKKKMQTTKHGYGKDLLPVIWKGLPRF